MYYSFYLQSASFAAGCFLCYCWFPWNWL